MHIFYDSATANLKSADAAIASVMEGAFKAMPTDIIAAIAGIFGESCQKLWMLLPRFRRNFNADAYGELFIKRDALGTLVFGYYHSIRGESSAVLRDRKEWHYKGRLHRGDDLPAVVITSSYMVWFDKIGSRARTCVIAAEWWWRGRRHRDDNPAYLSQESGLKWYNHGMITRESDNHQHYAWEIGKVTA